MVPPYPGKDAGARPRFSYGQALISGWRAAILGKCRKGTTRQLSRRVHWWTVGSGRSPGRLGFTTTTGDPPAAHC